MLWAYDLNNQMLLQITVAMSGWPVCTGLQAELPLMTQLKKSFEFRLHGTAAIAIT